MSDAPTPMAATLDGQFHGFAPLTLFKLQDGSYWLQRDSKTLRHHAVAPSVEIFALDDGHFLKVEGLESMVLVERVHDVIESQVFGRFTGWTGKTKVKLTNGQVWQQAQFMNKYAVKYMPAVLIYPSPAGHVMQVAGTRVRVRRLRQG